MNGLRQVFHDGDKAGVVVSGLDGLKLRSAMQMNRDELHELLISTFGLVSEAIVNDVSHTYFYQRIEWHPQRSTRVFRVIFDIDRQPRCIQLCASSDNNHSVLMHRPFSKIELMAAVRQEVATVQRRIVANDVDSLQA